MPLARVVAATNKPTCPSWERAQKRIEERRAILENARAMNVKRLQNDVQRIAKKEIEFAQKVFEEILPVRITWNEDAWTKLQESLPIRIEPVQADSGSPAPTEGDAKKPDGP